MLINHVMQDENICVSHHVTSECQRGNCADKKKSYINAIPTTHVCLKIKCRENIPLKERANKVHVHLIIDRPAAITGSFPERALYAVSFIRSYPLIRCTLLIILIDDIRINEYYNI
ncbi:hypothetical protein PUN28_000845 [Cardiocondyla obscurior]|uniref:Uncharacterized protein n=1 Tax=Cardiocondyla obscurior TaxID=286306 RepID=A0AAW2H1C5_9HYME